MVGFTLSLALQCDGLVLFPHNPFKPSPGNTKGVKSLYH
jgi:hypothetical protein